MQRFASSCVPGLLAAALLLNTAGCTGGPGNNSNSNSSPGKTQDGGAVTAAQVNLRPVALADFEQTLEGFRGKVVVVDYWQDTCTNCKKEFPHLVQLFNQHAQEGLVAVSVNLDDPADEKARKNALQFLQDKQATMTNLVLAPQQNPDDWFSKLAVLDDGIPATSVYDREGKRVKDFKGAGHHEEIEKLVVELLKKK